MVKCVIIIKVAFAKAYSLPTIKEKGIRMATTTLNSQRFYWALCGDTELCVTKIQALREEFAHECTRAYYREDSKFDFEASRKELDQNIEAAIKQLTKNDDEFITMFLNEKK